MHVVFLKFGPNKAQASQWMAGHKQWIQDGIRDGVFLLAGSLDSAQGGAILAVKLTTEEVAARVQADPFVAHGVVVPEIHGIAPSSMAEGFAALAA